MAFLYPKTPKPEAQAAAVQQAAPLTAPPERSDAEIAELAAQQRRKFYSDTAGRRSTLGGGVGVMGMFPTSSSRLLGVA